MCVVAIKRGAAICFLCLFPIVLIKIHLKFLIKQCPVLAQVAGSVCASEMCFIVHISCAAGEAALGVEAAWWCLVEKMNGSVLVVFCFFFFFPKAVSSSVFSNAWFTAAAQQKVKGEVRSGEVCGWSLK